MGYNSGDTYEEEIFNICSFKGIVPPGSNRAGADGNMPDLQVVNNSQLINVEIKNSSNPDYGQRKLDYNINTNTWRWAKSDKVSKLYEDLNLIEYIDKSFVPIWYRKRIKVNERYQSRPYCEYYYSDFKADQKSFEHPNIPIVNEALFAYYKNKNTYYIQIEDSGFYYLSEDFYNLEVPQFDGRLTLRFRLKHAGHTKQPPHACQFLGALKLRDKPTLSPYNLEENPKQKFPFINPF